MDGWKTDYFPIGSRSLFRGELLKSLAPLKTNVTLENPLIFNRKYIGSFMVDVPASHVKAFGWAASF